MTNLTELEQSADREARHGHRELVERLEEENRELALQVIASQGQADEALGRVAELEAEQVALLPWAMLGQAVMDGWPEIGDLDGFDLHDFAVEHGVLREVPGGYNPDQHIYSAGAVPERGDPWFEIIRFPERAIQHLIRKGGDDE